MTEKFQWMPNCREVSRMASEAMEGRLPLSRRMAMWTHLMMCRYCRRFRRQLYFLRRLSRIDEESISHSVEEPAVPELSPEARDRLKKAVQQRVGKGASTAK